jgi:hypothetical protein
MAGDFCFGYHGPWAAADAGYGQYPNPMNDVAAGTTDPTVPITRTSNANDAQPDDSRTSRNALLGYRLAIAPTVTLVGLLHAI